MTSENKSWDNLKADYLRQVEKALSSVKHPRGKEVLEDVRSHLDRRFAELGSQQQTWENFQSIITEMGPASDYAELLAPEAGQPKCSIRQRWLPWAGIIVVVVVAVVVSLMVIFSKPRPVTTEEFRRDFFEKVDKFDIDTATIKDVIKDFGQPVEYIWGNQILDSKNLPRRYVVVYPDGFCVFMIDDRVIELRHEGPGTGYLFHGKIKAGSTLDEVLEVVGQPENIVEGQENQFEDGVLYKDIEGREGYCYYGRTDQDVRFFFKDYKVIALYITRSDYGEGM